METENETEWIAFDYVCELAFEVTDRSGCNDLPDELVEKFKDEQIESQYTDGKKFKRKIMYDFDVIHWLKERTKKGGGDDES